MSFQAMSWAVKQKLKAVDKIVLLMLANRTNSDTGRCDPSMDRLADDCGLSKTTTKEAIKRLSDAGLIVIVTRRDGDVNLPNQYLLTMDDKHTHGGGAGADPLGVSEQGRGGAPAEGGVGRETPPKQELLNPKSLEALPTFDFSSWPEAPSPDVLVEWVTFRKRRRAPITELVLKQFGKVMHGAAPLGYTVDDVLAKCVTRGWTGVELSWLERDAPIQALALLGDQNAPAVRRTADNDPGFLARQQQRHGEILRKLDQRTQPGGAADGRTIDL